MLASGDQVGEEGPVVSTIVFRESGTFAGLRLNGGVFCVSFENSFVQRFIPENEMIEAAYETKAKDNAKPIAQLPTE